MDVSEFDFDLPSELIAQEPAAERGAARLLHVNRVSGVVVHTNISALPTLLRPGNLLVVNNTRVFPAAAPLNVCCSLGCRLRFRRVSDGKR